MSGSERKYAFVDRYIVCDDGLEGLVDYGARKDEMWNLALDLSRDPMRGHVILEDRYARVGSVWVTRFENGEITEVRRRRPDSPVMTRV